jgi:hypothetical protein
MAADPCWVVEGIHLGWTEPLFEAADLIIWLDNESSETVARRVVKRFVTQSLAESRRLGIRGLLRVPSYTRHLVELVRHMVELRRYYRPRHDPKGNAAEEASRHATEAFLETYAERTVRCRGAADVEALVSRLSRLDG